VTQSAAPISFLIDEDLSAKLAKVAKERGFHALATTQLPKLRGKDDGAVVRYATERQMILVTRNRIDHAEIYRLRDCHPGVVFFVSEHPKLNKLKYQLQMMALAISEIVEDEPVQQAITVTIRYTVNGKIEIAVEREELPAFETFTAVTAA
jgi:predicted nuclease of predicted toxin-antitoxin system